jgi:hypothetical protein
MKTQLLYSKYLLFQTSFFKKKLIFLGVTKIFQFRLGPVNESYTENYMFFFLFTHQIQALAPVP